MMNFIPVSRLEAKRHRRKLRRWSWVVIAYTSVSLMAFLYCRSRWNTDNNGQAAELAALTAKIKEHSQAAYASQRELSEVRSHLQAAHFVRDYPDWSNLLVVLARQFRGQMVLRECELMDDVGPGKGLPVPETAAKSPFVLRIAGYSRTQEEAGELASELDKTNIFDQVKLLKAKREPFREAEATAFRVECLLGKGNECK